MVLESFCSVSFAEEQSSLPLCTTEKKKTGLFEYGKGREKQKRELKDEGKKKKEWAFANHQMARCPIN